MTARMSTDPSKQLDLFSGSEVAAPSAKPPARSRRKRSAAMDDDDVDFGEIGNFLLPITQLLDRDMLQRIVDSDLLPPSTKITQFATEQLSPETCQRARAIEEHNAKVLLTALHKHFLEILLTESEYAP